MIAFESVTKTYPSGHTALDAVDFVIDPGEFVFLLGPSGSGKTTLLRLILRETQPTQGRIVVAQHNLGELPKREIPHLRRQIGAAFQDFKLLPDKSAFENVMVALDILGKSPKEMNQLTAMLLDRVGLKEKFHLYPSQLSGGEIQRVAIARALASDPVLLFADEPTGNLDHQTSTQIIDLLQQINDTGTTVIMATHDLSAIKRYPHRQIHLSLGKVTHDTKSQQNSPKPPSSKTSQNKPTTKHKNVSDK